MHSENSSPVNLTRILGMTEDEHEMLATALEYVLHQVRYDTKRNHYYLKVQEPNGLNTVIRPEEYDVLEGVSFRVIGDAFGYEC